MTIHELPDTLLARLRAGDREVLAEMIRLYYKRIYPIAFYITKEKKEAEDIVQGVFFKLWERREQFSTGEHIEAFLLTTCRNAGVDSQRAAQRKKRAHREIQYLLRDAEPPREEQIIREERSRELRYLIEALSPKRKEVIQLIYLEGMKVREVAAQLGISPITVQGHKSRALKKLRIAFSKKDTW